MIKHSVCKKGTKSIWTIEGDTMAILDAMHALEALEVWRNTSEYLHDILIYMHHPTFEGVSAHGFDDWGLFQSYCITNPDVKVYKASLDFDIYPYYSFGQMLFDRLQDLEYG